MPRMKLAHNLFAVIAGSWLRSVLDSRLFTMHSAVIAPSLYPGCAVALHHIDIASAIVGRHSCPTGITNRSVFSLIDLDFTIGNHELALIDPHPNLN
jgi:hypothetical protein